MSAPPLHIRVQRDKIMREDLASFIAKSFHETDPASRYMHNWHIDVLAHHLTECAEGRTNRLLINMPPRMLKSICCSVAFPAWLLGRQPHARLICASYAHHLALKHAKDCRALMASHWYRRIFPHTAFERGDDAHGKNVTTQKGFRLATSVGGSITGEGGDFIIVDDPQHASEVDSPTRRENTLNWFEQSLSTRLNDKQNGVMIVVQQRLHPDDLSAHLLEKGGWTHVSLPAISMQKKHYDMRPPYTREKDEVLHKRRENRETLTRIKRELGSFVFEAQYQQQPKVRAGNVFQPQWLKRYTELPANATIIQSWDTAIKTGLQHDYSVCATFYEHDGVHYLADIYRGKWDYPTLKRVIEQHAHQHNTDIMLMEDKASGQSMLQDLKREGRLHPKGVTPVKDKLTRAVAATAFFEAGRVALPHEAHWLTPFETELFQFPHSKHDDQVDAVTQYVNWVRTHTKRTPNMRRV